MDWATILLTDSVVNLYQAFITLMYPALFFLSLAYIIKGRALWADLKKALREFSLNVQILSFNILFSIPFVAIYVTAIQGFMLEHNIFLLGPETWDNVPLVITLFLAVFIGDFCHYWRHRLDHTKLFWPAHAVHHSDTEVTWLTAVRWHPINLLTMRGVGTVAMLLMGFPVVAILFNGMMRSFYGYFIHADLPWTYGKLGKIFVSPAMHRWHHSAEEQAFDKNFAEFFCMFDQAFGTYYLPGPCDGPLGVHDDMKPTLQSQITYAFTPKAYKPFWDSVKRRFTGKTMMPGE